MSCVSNSNAEPNAISKKWINSISDFREAPSAILDDIEITARCICPAKPYFSSFGKFAV